VKKTRYTVDFSEDEYRDFEALVKSSGSRNKAVLIRNSLKMFKFLLKSADKDQAITILLRDGEKVQIVIKT